jgi:hypothetical protein
MIKLQKLFAITKIWRNLISILKIILKGMPEFDIILLTMSENSTHDHKLVEQI